jgi:hypothetical protein
MAIGVMKYMIYAQYPRQEDTLLCAPVGLEDATYLRERVLPTMHPLSEDKYKTGAAVILRTAARWSYVLWEKSVIWCVEWMPGLLVFKFTCDAEMLWTAIRSPVPEFGGREAAEADVRAYDEDAINHQYNLVFRAWDAQFDEDYRRTRNFTPATDTEVAAYLAALHYVNELEAELTAVISDPNYSAWVENCSKNVATWAGEGVRL